VKCSSLELPADLSATQAGIHQFSNFRCQQGDVKQVPYWQPTVLNCESILYGVACSVHVNWYTFLLVSGKLQ